jgi:hypothetical protein
VAPDADAKLRFGLNTRQHVYAFGYAEIFQYLKELLIFATLAYYAYRTKAIHFLFLGLLFMVILLDDMMMLHERLGWFFVDWLDIGDYAGVKRQDFAQILSMSVLEGWVVCLIGITFFRLPGSVKSAVFRLYVLIFLLIFFGVLTDFLHSIVNMHMRGADLIEDGGEMLIMGFIAFHVYRDYSIVDHA